MAIAIDASESANLVFLEGTVDISSAAELKAALLLSLDSGREVCISLDKVSYLDLTAIQLLWAAEQQARRSSVVFRISGQMPELVSTALAEAGFPSIPAAHSAG